ncbi:MAG: trimethylamine methyltransferase family protein [Desulfobacterales bacterium]|nr:MAG: trimethylamine methyltransferase family protein [Desulfobacterales bacterium]
MIQTNSTEKKAIFFRVLSEDQILELIRSAFEIMAKVGFKVLHQGARKMLREAGGLVKGEQVKVSEFIVRQCLASAPKGWTIYNRNGERALEVEGRKSYYGTSTASPNTKDAVTGEFHPTTVADIAFAAKVADALEHIDWVMPMGSCQDVPAKAADLHEFYATVTNTTKPVVFLTYSARGAELVYEMAAEVVGGLDILQERPFLVLYPESISPLVFPGEVVDRMFVAADLGLPQMMGPTIQPGATGPVTLAGAVAQGLAESLMGLVLVQLRRPGSPVGLGCNFGIFDMSGGLLCIAAPEMSLALAAQAEVAQYFGLPTWGLAGSTEAKGLDAQAGAEAAFHILAQGQAGLNLIHDVGYMDMGMACAVEQLILGNELIGMTKRFLEGLQVNAETVAREVIARVGPGGNFLQEEHTFHHFRKELWRPSIFTRQHYSNWLESGAPDTVRKVREKIRQIKETHPEPSLPDNTLAVLEEIKTRGEKELSGTKGGV